jgi:predicted ATP-grasp superfamily ATP-dependent carboligase
MPPLKAGHVSDFSNSMAEAIETALVQELALRGESVPAAGADTRRVFFVAIARGVLQYLKEHEAEVLSSITFHAAPTSATAPVDAIDLNYSGS